MLVKLLLNVTELESAAASSSVAPAQLWLIPMRRQEVVDVKIAPGRSVKADYPAAIDILAEHGLDRLQRGTVPGAGATILEG